MSSLRTIFAILLVFGISVLIYRGNNIFNYLTIPDLTPPSSIWDVGGIWRFIQNILAIPGSIILTISNSINTVASELVATPEGSILLFIIIILIFLALTPILLKIARVIAEAIPL